MLDTVLFVPTVQRRGQSLVRDIGEGFAEEEVTLLRL